MRRATTSTATFAVSPHVPEHVHDSGVRPSTRSPLGRSHRSCKSKSASCKVYRGAALGPQAPCEAEPLVPCVALHCPALPCIALHCPALPCIALHCPALPSRSLVLRPQGNRTSSTATSEFATAMKRLQDVHESQAGFAVSLSPFGLLLDFNDFN